MPTRARSSVSQPTSVRRCGEHGRGRQLDLRICLRGVCQRLGPLALRHVSVALLRHVSVPLLRHVLAATRRQAECISLALLLHGLLFAGCRWKNAKQMAMVVCFLLLLLMTALFFVCGKGFCVM